MTLDVLFLVLAACAVVLAVSGLIVALSVRGLAKDARAAAATGERLARLLAEELPPTLTQLRELSAEAEQLTRDLEPRLQRTDRLVDEAEDTLAALRATLLAAEEIVRGPLDAVDRARQTVRSVGEGLAVGADRLRREVEKRAVRREDA